MYIFTIDKTLTKGVFLATVVGIPMYADIFGTIPIAEVLFTKEEDY